MPLDPRHPTRHNIWTAVSDRLQQHVYEHGGGLRFDTDNWYTTNAVEDVSDYNWPMSMKLNQRIQRFQSELGKYAPRLLITFGDDPCKFAAHALGLKDIFDRRKLSVRELGDLFRSGLDEWKADRTNLCPLLHACVARAAWHEVGKRFSGKKEETDDYFEYVGRRLGALLLREGKDWPIWAPRNS